MVLPQCNTSTGGSEPDPDDLISFTDGELIDDFEDSTCSTPYVSAPSSPGRDAAAAAATTNGGYFFSAPASPMHFVLSSAASASCPPSPQPVDTSSFEFEFEFSSRCCPNGSVAIGSMSSADELFLNGQIRPMKLSSHLQRPQILAPLMDLDKDECHEEADESAKNGRSGSLHRGRDLNLRSRSLHRKARSLSPLRNIEFQWLEHEDNDKAGRVDKEDKQAETTTASSETTPSCSASSSRSSSSGRNSKKWVFLKDLLYRSKSEGRANGKEKIWSSIMSKEKSNAATPTKEKPERQKLKQKQKQKQKQAKGRPTNGVAIARQKTPVPSPHELHYTANRAQAEELKKKTYLPYRQGLLGCLGFNAKGYGALNGLTRALNPVSSR